MANDRHYLVAYCGNVVLTPCFQPGVAERSLFLASRLRNRNVESSYLEKPKVYFSCLYSPM